MSDHDSISFSRLDEQAAAEHLAALGGGWELADGPLLTRRFKFTNFEHALQFVNRVGELAEAMDHHPEICFSWGWVQLSISTHSAAGLSQADFVFAERAGQLRA